MHVIRSVVAGRGIAVTAVDPAAAMLDVARAKPHAHAVRWIHGDATTLPALQVDAAFMTANVAQVFLTDDDWDGTLIAARQALRSGGWLVFETRVPARRAWEQWTPELTRTAIDVPGGTVESWENVVDVTADLVTFQSMTAFSHDDVVIESVSNYARLARGLVDAGIHTAASVRDDAKALSGVLDNVATLPGADAPRIAEVRAEIKLISGS